MADNLLNQLLSRYMAGTINDEGLEKLKILVGITDDDELSKHVSRLWMELEMEENPTARILNEIYETIRPVQKRRIVLKNIRRFTGAAAILLILLLSALSFHLYTTRENGYIIDAHDIIVQTERGQQATVILPDGSKVKLNAGSLLRYKQNYGQENRWVDLSGEAFFEITKDERKTFTLQTEHVDIQVLGTSFNVYSYDDEDEVEMTLISGKIKIIPHAEPKNIIYLSPNEKFFYNKNSGKTKVQNTDNRFETAWLRGALVFRSEPIQNVLKKIERKYGVTIHLNIPSIENDKFTGSIESEYITEVMKILQAHYAFKYRIEGDDLYIFSK